MNRRAFLKAIGSAALMPILPRRLWAASYEFQPAPSFRCDVAIAVGMEATQ